MPLTTTVIGSYPKPDFLPTPDWFRSEKSDHYKAVSFAECAEKLGEKELESLQDQAARQVLKEQTDLGIDVVTDGEVRRENYVFHFCRSLNGIDFTNLTYKEYRNGACKSYLPTVVGKVSPQREVGWLAAEWRHTQSLTDAPVKMTIPGPMTIINTTANKVYKDEQELSWDLVSCINSEIQALAKAGCKHIQVDEPVLVRQPQKALEYGIEHLSKCFSDTTKYPDVCKIVHLCCGYPQYLDQKDYEKADPGAYLQLAERLDKGGFDAVSIEDAHRHNDLRLFKHFKHVKVILGSVTIAESQVESVEEIQNRVQAVLTSGFPASRLILAPDCGLAMLPPGVLKEKLSNLVQAAHSLP